MDSTEQEPQPRACSRRRLLVSTGLAGLAFSPATTSARPTEEPTQQQEDDQEQPETAAETEIALSAAAPTFDRPDHEGLFLEVHGESDATVPEGVTACEFLGETPVPYAVTLFDATEETDAGSGYPSESVPIYVDPDSEEISPDAFFVINRTDPCSEAFLTAELEATDEESIEGDVGPGTGPDEDPGT